MNNEKMAKQLARLCFKPKKNEEDLEFAVQLFIEDLVLPKEVTEYSEKQLEEFILKYLSIK